MFAFDCVAMLISIEQALELDVNIVTFLPAHILRQQTWAEVQSPAHAGSREHLMHKC